MIVELSKMESDGRFVDFRQESSLFRTCTYEFMAPSPFDSTEIKVSLRDGHYLVLLYRVKDVVTEIDSDRNFSSL